MRVSLVLSAAALGLAASAGAQSGDRAKPDADSDGTITRAEMARFADSAFARADVDGNGQLDSADRDARRDDRFGRIDTDSDGEVTQAELRTARDARQAQRETRRQMRDGQRSEKIAERFARLDTDNSGGLSQAEMEAGREARQGARGERRGGRQSARGGRRQNMARMVMRTADANRDGVITRAEFDAVLGDRRNQLDRQRDDVSVTARDLLDIRSAGGSVTLAGVRANVSITVRYLESWLRGIGAAAIDNLMEDAATAEISRSQLWQWMHHDIVTAEGEQITRELVERELASVLASLPKPEGHMFAEAEDVFRTVTLQEDFPTFLTVPAYARYLVEREEGEGQEAAAA